MRPELLNPLVLAFLGDSVLEVMVREHLVIYHPGKNYELQQLAVQLVNARSQKQFVLDAIEHNWLTEREIEIFKRGRNTKVNRNDSNEHRHSTGFEAIIGQLYLEKDEERLNEIFKIYLDYFGVE